MEAFLVTMINVWESALCTYIPPHRLQHRISCQFATHVKQCGFYNTLQLGVMDFIWNIAFVLVKHTWCVLERGSHIFIN